MKTDEIIQLGVGLWEKGVAVEDRKTACVVYESKKQKVAIPSIIDLHDMGLRTVFTVRTPKGKRLFNA
ncbi:hypothetical protein TNCV_3447861 [Trichonephila clavipes]|nr:hypothetical protein TNCV_3447861 [Trichonephila clavipes]